MTRYDDLPRKVGHSQTRAARIPGGLLAAALTLLVAVRGMAAVPIGTLGDPDPRTLDGKVMCGYQGWFAAPGDGYPGSWVHYPRGGKFEPGFCTIDLWPDMTELGADERYPTLFRHADGSVATVFSSRNAKTVSRHFLWMKQHGIDGAFFQRFATGLRSRKPTKPRNSDIVMRHVRAAAREHGRLWAVMYDISGLKAGEARRVVGGDWARLVRERRVTTDPTYLHHRGRPVVVVWGVGFGGRDYTVDDCDQMIDALKEHPADTSCTVMLGLPTGWRTLRGDSVRDKKLHDVLDKADILSPWTVGRYNSPAFAARHGRQVWRPDIAWCRERGKDYLPVVFPGFSWHNMKLTSRLNQIPRLRGQFLWSQFAAAKRAGAKMIYVAMFDEIDEGTAIFKCTNDPPVGASPFVTYEGLPTDHYLWLTGQGARMLRGEIPLSDEMPRRAN